MAYRRRDVRPAWALVVAVLATSVSSLYLLGVLGLGAMWVTTDWSGLACFDGDEPACSTPSKGEAGLAAVQASSWILGSVAAVAIFGAIVLTLRLRRVAHVVAVFALCGTSAIITQVLWSRL